MNASYLYMLRHVDFRSLLSKSEKTNPSKAVLYCRLEFEVIQPSQIIYVQILEITASHLGEMLGWVGGWPPASHLNGQSYIS